MSSGSLLLGNLNRKSLPSDSWPFMIGTVNPAKTEPPSEPREGRKERWSKRMFRPDDRAHRIRMGMFACGTALTQLATGLLQQAVHPIYVPNNDTHMCAAARLIMLTIGNGGRRRPARARLGAVSVVTEGPHDVERGRRGGAADVGHGHPRRRGGASRCRPHGPAVDGLGLDRGGVSSHAGVIALHRWVAHVAGPRHDSAAHWVSAHRVVRAGGGHNRARPERAGAACKCCGISTLEQEGELRIICFQLDGAHVRWRALGTIRNAH